MLQCPSPKNYAAAKLSHGFLLAEPGLVMNVREPRDQSVGHCPLDRSPVVRNEHVRTTPHQFARACAKRGEQICLRDRNGYNSAVNVPADISGCSGCAVKRDHDMPERRAQVVEDSCHAERYSADPKTRKHMDAKRRKRSGISKSDQWGFQYLFRRQYFCSGAPAGIK